MPREDKIKAAQEVLGASRPRTRLVKVQTFLLHMDQVHLTLRFWSVESSEPLGKGQL